MPFKHQADSYRNRAGIRYICDGDILESDDDLKSAAQRRVEQLRSEGYKAFYEKHDGGSYYRVFVEERYYTSGIC